MDTREFAAARAKHYRAQSRELTAAGRHGEAEVARGLAALAAHAALRTPIGEQLTLPMDLRSKRERRASRLKSQISAQPRNRCHDCGRTATACWSMPCLTLEVALSKGAAAINRWATQSDAPFRVEAKS